MLLHANWYDTTSSILEALQDDDYDFNHIDEEDDDDSHDEEDDDVDDDDSHDEKDDDVSDYFFNDEMIVIVMRMMMIVR
jgi:hypothetical protein